VSVGALERWSVGTEERWNGGALERGNGKTLFSLCIRVDSVGKHHLLPELCVFAPLRVGTCPDFTNRVRVSVVKRNHPYEPDMNGMKDKKKSFPWYYMYLPRETWGIGLSVVITGIIIMCISALTGPEIMGHLRGGRQLIVWPPGDDGKERQLSVYSEGNAFVGGTPERLSDSETWYIERLIEQWCASPPRIS